METNLHSLPDVLKVVLQDLLLLCHYCPSGMGSLAILQENKTYTCMKNNYADPFMTWFLIEICVRCGLKVILCHCYTA